MVVAAKGARVDAALTVWFTVSPSRLGVSAERMGRRARTVVNSSARSGVPVGRPISRVVGGTSAVAVSSAAPAGVPVGRPISRVVGGTSAVAVSSAAPADVPVGRPVPRVVGGTAVVAVNSARSSPASVVDVPVVKRAAPGVVVVVVIVYVSVVPIASPMIPAPSPTSEPTDSKADSEPEGGAVIPDSGIRVPTRPRHDGISINHPRIVRGDVNHLGVSRLNDDCRVLRGYGLLRRGLEIAGFLRPLAHHLYGIHHILSLVVVSVA